MKKNILLIIKSVVLTLIYNLVIAVCSSYALILSQSFTNNTNILHIVISVLVIALNVYLFFFLLPKIVGEKYSKKLIIPLSVVLFICSAVVAIIW